MFISSEVSELFAAPRDCSPWAPLSMGLNKSLEVGSLCLSQGSSDQETLEPRSPALQMNSSVEPPGRNPGRATILGQDLQLLRVSVPASILQRNSSYSCTISVMPRKFILDSSCECYGKTWVTFLANSNTLVLQRLEPPIAYFFYT